MARDKLKLRLQKIELEIEEVKKRLPAHSVQISIMQEMIDLEDERDSIIEQLNTEKND